MRVPNHISLEAFKADWLEGVLVADMCRRHTLSKDHVVRLRVRLELPPRLDRSKRRRLSLSPVPTPEEIEQRAAEVQAGWDADTERKRRVCDTPEYVIPTDVETPEDFDPQWYD